MTSHSSAAGGRHASGGEPESSARGSAAAARGGRDSAGEDAGTRRRTSDAFLPATRVDPNLGAGCGRRGAVFGVRFGMSLGAAAGLDVDGAGGAGVGVTGAAAGAGLVEVTLGGGSTFRLGSLTPTCSVIAVGLLSRPQKRHNFASYRMSSAQKGHCRVRGSAATRSTTGGGALANGAGSGMPSVARTLATSRSTCGASGSLYASSQ